MRTPRPGPAPIVVLVVALLVVALSACSGSGSGRRGSATTDPGPNPTSSDPGPNPTSSDPGPNTTTNGPFTEAGTLRLGSPLGCITLEQGSTRLDLHVSGYELGTSDGHPALVGTADGRAIATSGDRFIVTGYPRAATGRCGERFDVENVVNVAPAGS